jgi:hypothetical protein
MGITERSNQIKTSHPNPKGTNIYKNDSQLSESGIRIRNTYKTYTDWWIDLGLRAIILPDKQTNKFIRLMVDKMTKSIKFCLLHFLFLRSLSLSVRDSIERNFCDGPDPRIFWNNAVHDYDFRQRGKTEFPCILLGKGFFPCSVKDFTLLDACDGVHTVQCEVQGASGIVARFVTQI